MNNKRVVLVISEKTNPDSMGSNILFTNIFNGILKNHPCSYVISQNGWIIKLLRDSIYNKYDIIMGTDVHFRGSLISLISKVFLKKSVIIICGKYWIERREIKNTFFGYFKLKLFNMTEKITFKYSSAIVAPDREVLSYIQNKTSNKIIYIPDFGVVDINKFQFSEDIRSSYRIKLGIGQNDFVLLFVGSLIERDGIDRILKIYYCLNREYDNIWLIIVGTGNQLPNIQKLKKTENFERLLILGYIPHDIIQNYMMVTDLGLLLLNEPQCGFGSIPLELLSLKIPIISSKAGMLDEVVINGKTGFAIDTDTEAIEKIHEIMKSKFEYEEMKSYSRHFIEENYSLDSFERRIELLIDQI